MVVKIKKEKRKKSDLNGDPNENQQKLANSIVVSGALLQWNKHSLWDNHNIIPFPFFLLFLLIKNGFF